MSHGNLGNEGVVILQLLQRPEEVKSKVIVMAQTRHYGSFSSQESI